MEKWKEEAQSRGLAEISSQVNGKMMCNTVQVYFTTSRTKPKGKESGDLAKDIVGSLHHSPRMSLEELNNYLAAANSEQTLLSKDHPRHSGGHVKA